MKPDKQIPVQSIYTIFVEEPDDFYFHPRGVLFVDAEQNHSLFCSDIDHNFLLKVIRKFPYAALEKGIEFNGCQFELKNITEPMRQKFGDTTNAIPLVLQELYQTSPRQYAFLGKLLQDGSVHSHFAP
ncbi:hypothetical protein [Effusibacillus pohliae]|uniref:hypothetical protein n=1 Tax=Effusibacillus pohliae TaxID=232270 RepID=UPI00036A029D|nr:hypothetical protein [Effusibacillus pohliae]